MAIGAYMADLCAHARGQRQVWPLVLHILFGQCCLCQLWLCTLASDQLQVSNTILKAGQEQKPQHWQLTWGDVHLDVLLQPAFDVIAAATTT